MHQQSRRNNPDSAASNLPLEDGSLGTEDPTQARLRIQRARALGRKLIQIYETEAGKSPPELLELLDIAQTRLVAAGYYLEEDDD
jgi:hypothetical protein